MRNLFMLLARLYTLAYCTQTVMPVRRWLTSYEPVRVVNMATNTVLGLF